MSYRENLTPVDRMAVIEKQFAIFMDAASRQTTVETELEKLQPVFKRDIETAEDLAQYQERVNQENTLRSGLEGAKLAQKNALAALKEAMHYREVWFKVRYQEIYYALYIKKVWYPNEQCLVIDTWEGHKDKEAKK